MTSRLSVFSNAAAVSPRWHVLDATGMRIGRVANEVARLIMGKHKPFYTPNVLCGDYVVVKNCQRMTFSGRKWEQKSYRWHTGWPGGLRKVYAQDMLQRQPDELLRLAVLGMLPHNKMRVRRMGLLRIYVGDDSPHDAQDVSAVNHAQWPRPVGPMLLTAQEVAIKRELMAEPAKVLQRYGGYTVELVMNPESGLPSLELSRVEGAERLPDGVQKMRQTLPKPGSRARNVAKEERLQQSLQRIRDRNALFDAAAANLK